jgi:dUTP diphosphatase
MDKQKVQVFNNSKNDLPHYSTDLAAGFDIRVDFSKVDNVEELKGNGLYSFGSDEEGRKLVILPQGRVLLPTGLHVAIPDNYELQVRPRSGLALKHGITIVNSPGTVDCFSEKSTIKTINGNKFVSELKINDIVLSVNDKLDIEKDEITAIVDTGEQEVYIIETENGVLEITPNTDVYTDNGIKKAHELKEDDNIIYYE